MGPRGIKRQIRSFRKRANAIRRSHSITGTVMPDFTLEYETQQPGRTTVPALPSIPDRSHWDLEPGWRLSEAMSFRKPKVPREARGKAIPYCSKFYRAALYEPEPNLQLKEMMSWVDPPPS